MSQNFRLFHVSNLSVRNFRIFLLMYTGSAARSRAPLAEQTHRRRRETITRPGNHRQPDIQIDGPRAATATAKTKPQPVIVPKAAAPAPAAEPQLRLKPQSGLQLLTEAKVTVNPRPGGVIL